MLHQDGKYKQGQLLRGETGSRGYKPSRHKQGESVNGGFALHGITVLLFQRNHFGAQSDCSEDGHRDPEGLEKGAVQHLELSGKCDAVNLISNVNKLHEADDKQHKVPGEYVSSADVYPRPDRGAQEPQPQQAEDVQEPEEPTAAHKTYYKQDTGKLVDGAFRLFLPGRADWVFTHQAPPQT